VLDFWENVDATSADGCWEWQRRVTDGYGNYKGRRAHRVAYELTLGAVPAVQVLDHLCRNRRCVRPTHLEPVSQRVNAIRGANARYQQDPIEVLSYLIETSGMERRVNGPMVADPISTKLLVSALRQAGSQGLSLKDLVNMTQRRRSWVYARLKDLSATQVRRGRWSL